MNGLDQALLKEVRKLKADIAAVKEKVTSPPQVPKSLLYSNT